MGDAVSAGQPNVEAPSKHYNIGESVSFLRRLMTVSIVSLDGYSGRNFLHQDKMCVG